MKNKIAFLVLISISFVFSQQTITINADYDRVAKFNSQSPGSYIGANELNADMSLSQKAYYNYNNEEWFVLMQWQIPDNIIPDGSTIDFVEVKFWYDSIVHAYYLYDYDVDITASTLPFSNYDEIHSNYVLDDFPSSDGWTVNNSNSFPELITSVQNSLQNDRVTFIVEKISENNVSGKVSYPSLNITFSPPQQTVTVRQKRSNNSEFGMVDHWENNQWEDAPSGTPYVLQVGNTEYFQAETTISQSDKFNNWNTNLSFKNYEGIEITNDLDDLTANFISTNVLVQRKMDFCLI